MQSLQRAPVMMSCVCDGQKNVEAFVFLLGAPSMAYVGYGLSKWSYKRAGAMKDVSNPFLVRVERCGGRLIRIVELLWCG